MSRESAQAEDAKSLAIAHWQIILRDEIALLEMPGAYHNALLRGAHALYQSRVIDNDDLGDLLELADAALAFAVESLLDIETRK